MARKIGAFSGLVSLAVWLTGIIVSLSVGFSMTNAGQVAGALTLPLWLGGAVVAQVAGWIVVILTLISVVLAIIDKFK